MVTFYKRLTHNDPHMQSDSGRRTAARLLLVFGLIAIVALAGCVQGGEEENESGFNPEEAASGGNGGQSNGGGGGGGGDDQSDDGPTLLEEEAAKGFDALIASSKIKEELNQRRDRVGQQPLEHSQSLKVAARAYSRSLTENEEVQSEVRNGSITNLSVSRDDILDRYEEHNAWDCQKSGKWFPGQLNHVTYFNRTLETSKERLIRYDNEELLAIAVVEDWMSNSTTRDTILETGYRQVGVGTVHNESKGIVYVTANLC